MSLTLSLYSLDEKSASDFELGPEYAPSADGEELLCCHSLGRNWHVVHFLLTATAEPCSDPLGLLLDAGVHLDDVSEDVWAVSTKQVRAFRDALCNVSDEELRRRFNPQAIAAADLYDGHGLVDEDWNYIAEGIPELRAFSDACAVRGCGAIITIC